VIGPSQRLLPDNTQHSQATVIHASGGIRTRNLSKPAAADLLLGLRDNWDRPFWHFVDTKSVPDWILQRHCATARNVC